MGDKIRFGIIGGGMAGPLNAGALRDIPEAEVVAFCDVKEDVARNSAKSTIFRLITRIIKRC